MKTIFCRDISLNNKLIYDLRSKKKVLYKPNINRLIYPLYVDNCRMHDEIILKNLTSRTKYYLENLKSYGCFGGKVIIDNLQPFTIVKMNQLNKKKFKSSKKTNKNQYIIHPIRDINEHEFYELESDQWNSFIVNSEKRATDKKSSNIVMNKDSFFRFVLIRSNINLLQFLKYKPKQTVLKLIDNNDFFENTYNIKQSQMKNLKLHLNTDEHFTNTIIISNPIRVLLSNIVRIKRKGISNNLSNLTEFKTCLEHNLKTNNLADSNYHRNEKYQNQFMEEMENQKLLFRPSIFSSYFKKESTYLILEEKFLRVSMEKLNEKNYWDFKEPKNLYKEVEFDEKSKRLQFIFDDITDTKSSISRYDKLRQNANISFTFTQDEKMNRSGTLPSHEGSSMITLSYPSYNVSKSYRKSKENSDQIVNPHLADKQTDTISDSMFSETNNACNLQKFTDKKIIYSNFQLINAANLIHTQQALENSNFEHNKIRKLKQFIYCKGFKTRN